MPCEVQGNIKGHVLTGDAGGQVKPQGRLNSLMSKSMSVISITTLFKEVSEDFCCQLMIVVLVMLGVWVVMCESQ